VRQLEMELEHQPEYNNMIWPLYTTLMWAGLVGNSGGSETGLSINLERARKPHRFGSLSTISIDPYSSISLSSSYILPVSFPLPRLL
jgi:hypothetical protein